MVTTNNMPEAFTVGRQAGSAWRDAQKHGEGGDAKAAYALFLAIEEDVDFVGVIPGKDGEDSERFNFTVLDMIRIPEPVAENGKKDVPHITARNNAIATQLFGLGEADNAFMSRFRRALVIAAHINASLETVEDETEHAAARDAITIVTRKRARSGVETMIAFLTVPAFMLFDPKNPEHGLNEQQIKTWDKLLRYSAVELDGAAVAGVRKANASLNALRARADVVAGRSRGRQKPRQTAEQAFTGSLTFIDKNVSAMLSDGGEPDVALSKTLRLRLFLLQQKLAALFAEEPLSEDEQQELDRQNEAAKQQQQQQSSAAA